MISFPGVQRYRMPGDEPQQKDVTKEGRARSVVPVWAEEPPVAGHSPYRLDVTTSPSPTTPLDMSEWESVLAARCVLRPSSSAQAARNL